MTTLSTNDFDLEYDSTVTSPAPDAHSKAVDNARKRFEGKSPDELIDMHVNLEKVLQRQGNELGQVRKIVDQQTQLIQTKLLGNTNSPEVKPVPVTAETLLNDPSTTVRTVVAPEIQKTNDRVDQLELSMRKSDFETKHTSYVQDLNNPEFQEWVLGSKTRANLLQKLNNYDFDAGTELWDIWSEHTQAKQATEQARKTRVKDATTVKVGSTEPVGKPVYSRAKLAELQMRALNGDMAAKARWEDPAFQSEYQSAYAENRVR